MESTCTVAPTVPPPLQLRRKGRRIIRRVRAAAKHLTIGQQPRVIGATWLDQQLINGGKNLGERGFGSEVREALPQGVDFPVEQGLAAWSGERVVLARNLLATLRERDVARVVEGIGCRR